MIKNVQEGRTFLVEASDGHFALVRVLEVSKVGVNVEYVYQPSGSTIFDVRKGEQLDVAAVMPLRAASKVKSLMASAVAAPPVADVTAAPGVATPPAPAMVKTGFSGPILTPETPRKPVLLEPPFSNHMQQRQMMIETRMKIVRGPAASQKEIDRKVDAIEELQQMHADEATDEFVKQVAFMNPRARVGKEFQDSVHPCFAALKKMGKAASNSAVKGLREMDLTVTGDGWGG